MKGQGLKGQEQSDERQSAPCGTLCFPSRNPVTFGYQLPLIYVYPVTLLHICSFQMSAITLRLVVITITIGRDCRFT